MRDRSTLATLAAAKPEASDRTGTTGGQEVELEFWRAIKDGNDPDDFELYVQQFPTGIYAALAKRKLAKLRGIESEDANVAEVATREVEEATKREAQFKKELADVPKAKMPIGVLAGVIIAIAAAGGGAWYFLNKSSLEKQAALTAALETATKASQELQQAQARQLQSLKALEQARAAEDEARKSGDLAKLKEAQEAAKRAEAEAAKQADAVKQREAAASDARMQAQDAAKPAKQAATKMAEPQQTASVPAPASTPIQAVTATPAPKMEAEPQVAAVAPEVAKAEIAKAPSAPRAMSRSERERSIDEETARRVAESASMEPKSAPTVVASAPSAKGPESEFETLYQQARALEDSGKAAEAIRIYRRAARGGSGPAAKRLGEIFDKGIPGVPRDYAESLQWYETARQLGETIESSSRRAESAPVVREPARTAPVPAAKAARPPEPVKKSEPAPVPATVPESPKVAAAAPSPARVPEPAKAEPAAPASELKSGWLSLRGWLIALFVLALIAWRRYRRREKAEARQAQRQVLVASDEVVPVLKEKATRPIYGQGSVARQSESQGDSTLFVSYSHKDRPRVEPIVSVIEEMGRRVWIDRTDITGQTGWAGQIVRAIRECRAVVLMASPNSYNSDQVVRELYLAMNHRKTIVPIEIEPAEMPDELQYILAPFQHHRLSGGETRAVLGRALAAV
jgi:hypothetical protein